MSGLRYNGQRAIPHTQPNRYIAMSNDTQTPNVANPKARVAFATNIKMAITLFEKDENRKEVTKHIDLSKVTSKQAQAAMMYGFKVMVLRAAAAKKGTETADIIKSVDAKIEAIETNTARVRGSNYDERTKMAIVIFRQRFLNGKNPEGGQAAIIKMIEAMTKENRAAFDAILDVMYKPEEEAQGGDTEAD